MRLYYMHFPNREVESSFNDCLLEYYAAVKQQDAAKLQLDLVSAVGHGNVNEFMKILQRAKSLTAKRVPLVLMLHAQVYVSGSSPNDGGST